MSYEYQPSSPEKQASHEALEQAGHDRLNELYENLEAKAERPDERDAETLKADAIEKAAESAPLESERTAPAEKQHAGPISRDQRDASFAMTMSQTRRHMKAPSRTFSKVIHTKAIEKASDVGATTVARPNAILAGAVFAFIITLALYLITKNLGYRLSGSETIAGFALGWLLGLLFDYFRVMITGRKAS